MSDANSSFGQKTDDMFVDELLLGMDDSGKVNVDQVRDETLEYQLYGKQDVSSFTTTLLNELFSKLTI